MIILAVYAEVQNANGEGKHSKGLYPQTDLALTKFAPTATLCDTSKNDQAYWETLKGNWRGEQDIIVIEQDIEIREDTISSLVEDDAPWSTYGYWLYPKGHQRWVDWALGCTKFSAKLQTLVTPDMIEAKGKEWTAWYNLDERLRDVFYEIGIQQHCLGEVAHHHDYTGEDPLPSIEERKRIFRRL
jgi:hypothetical protein